MVLSALIEDDEAAEANNRDVPYFPVYKSNWCISRPYVLSLKVEILLSSGV